MGRFGLKGVGARATDDDRRKRQRSDVALPANIDTTVASGSVVLMDVSAKGAHVRGERLPKVGDYIKFKVENSTVFATVIWVKGENGGLRFDGNLSDEELRELRHATLEAKQLGLEPDQMRARHYFTGGR